jgi:hypothetical protein
LIEGMAKNTATQVTFANYSSYQQY